LETFGSSERAAAEQLARADGRLAKATADPRQGVTEVLAGGPVTVWRWQEAAPAAKAVITAAIDARRIGLPAPITAELLAALARAYLPAVEEDDAWFAPALAEVTTIRRGGGVIAPMMPVPDADNRRTVGYVVSDYLLQYGLRARADAHVPALVWREIARLVSDPDELYRAATAAERGQSAAAEALYRAAADTGSVEAPTGLAALLIARNRLDETQEMLRAAAATGGADHYAPLAYLLEWRGRIDEAAETWREAIAAGDPDGRRALTDLLHIHDRSAEAERLWLDALACGDPRARSGMADYLELRGDHEGAERSWRAAVDAGEPGAWIGLADHLGHRGRTADQADLWSQALAAGERDVHGARARWRERGGTPALEDWELALRSGDHVSTSERSRLTAESTTLILMPALAAALPPVHHFPYDHFRHMQGVQLQAALISSGAAIMRSHVQIDLMLFLVGAEQRMRGSARTAPSRDGLAELVRVHPRLAGGQFAEPRQAAVHHQLVRDARHGRSAETAVGYIPAPGWAVPVVKPIEAVPTTCPACHSAVADLSRPFCPDCGARLDQPPTDPRPRPGEADV
jgi:tetratricopeptide (TPR) repeat protein